MPPLPTAVQAGYYYDSDGDGFDDTYVPDPWEDPAYYGYSTPPSDQDGDGWEDALDPFPADARLNPQTDPDADGVPSELEWFYGMNDLDPADGAADLDGDGFSNAEAFQQGWVLDAALVSPVPDLDGDRLNDITEAHWAQVHPGSLDPGNPLDPVADYDQDGVMNFEELTWGLDLASPTSPATGEDLAFMQLATGDYAAFVTPGYPGYSATDPDADGLPSLLEYQLLLNPRSADSDEDGVPDGEEDTDGDGFGNLAEVAAGTLPGQAASHPEASPAGGTGGDGSGSTNGTGNEQGNGNGATGSVPPPVGGTALAATTDMHLRVRSLKVSGGTITRHSQEEWIYTSGSANQSEDMAALTADGWLVDFYTTEVPTGTDPDGLPTGYETWYWWNAKKQVGVAGETILPFSGPSGELASDQAVSEAYADEPGQVYQEDVSGELNLNNPASGDVFSGWEEGGGVKVVSEFAASKQSTPVSDMGLYPQGEAAEVWVEGSASEVAQRKTYLILGSSTMFQWAPVWQGAGTVTFLLEPGMTGVGRVEAMTGAPPWVSVHNGRLWVEPPVEQGMRNMVRLSPVDIDIDSDNNNGGDVPDRSGLEEASQKGSKIGKVVAVNDGDWDGDGVPDYADGLDKFAEKGMAAKQDGSLQTAPLIPLVVEVPGGTFKIKLKYPASDPNAVAFSSDANGAPKYDRPSSGNLRLWKHDSDTERKVASVAAEGTAAGDFIPADTELEPSDLGTSSGGVFTLYLESVGISTALKDQKISLWVKPVGAADWTMADEVAVTSYSAYTCAPSEDGSSVTRITNPVVSLPRPVVSISQISVSHPRLDADGSTIIGDLVLTGSVTSDVCDLVPQSKGGMISTAEVSLNGLAGAGGQMSLTVSKTADTSNLRRPYPYRGTFSKTMTAVPLLQGLNRLEIGVRDPVYHLAGEATATFEVTVSDTTAPGGGTVPPGTEDSSLEIVYPGGTPMGETSAVAENQLYVKLTRDSSTVSGLLSPTTDATRYMDAASGLVLEVLEGGPGSEAESDRVKVTVQAADGGSETFTGIESGADTKMFRGHNTYSTPGAGENADTSNLQVGVTAVDYDNPIPEGRIDPFLVKIDGPEELFELIQTLKQGDREMPVAEVPGGQGGTKQHFIGLPGEDNAPAVSLLVPIQPFVPVSEAPPPETGDSNGVSGWLPPPVGTDEELLNGSDAIIQEADQLKALLDPSGDGRITTADLKKRWERMKKAIGPDDWGDFGSGFMDGVGANLSDQWQGVKDMPSDTWALLGKGADKAKAAILAAPDATVSAAKKWWQFNRKVGLVLVFATEKVFDANLLTENMRAEAVGAISQARDKVVAAGRAVSAGVNATVNAVTRAGEIANRVLTDGPAFMALLKDGNFAAAKQLGPDAYEALQIAAGLFLQMEEFLDSMPYAEKGYFCGYVFTEVLVSVAVTAAATAATAGAGAALAGPRMVRLYQVILKSDKIRAQMTQMGCWNKLSSYLDNMIQYILKGGCFAAGTLVMTAQGMVPIETVTPGTWVLSASEHGGVREYRQVVETFTTHPDALVEVSVKAESGPQAKSLPETILSTEEHPFYVLDETFTASEGNGHVSPPGTWRGASALHAGDRVWLSNGESGEVTKVRRLPGAANRTLTTYNFEVSEHHTYFVGGTGVWVHNACPKKAAIEKAKAAFNASDNGNDKERLGRFLDWHKNKAKRKLTDNEFGHAVMDFAMDALGAIADDLGDNASYDDWMAAVSDERLGLGQLKYILKAGGDGTTQGGFAVHHIPEKWIWDDLGITLGADKDKVACIPLPGLAGNETHWKDFKAVKGFDPPYHNGGGLAGELNQLMHIHAPNADKSGLLDDIYKLYKNEPRYAKTGMAKVFRGFMNATLRKHGKTTWIIAP